MKKKVIGIFLVITILCSCVTFFAQTVSASTFPVSGRIYWINYLDSGFSLRSRSEQGLDYYSRHFVVNRINSQLNTEYHFRLVQVTSEFWEIHPIYDNIRNETGQSKVTVATTFESDNTRILYSSKLNNPSRQRFKIYYHGNAGYNGFNIVWVDPDGVERPLRISANTGRMLVSSFTYNGGTRDWERWGFTWI